MDSDPSDYSSGDSPVNEASNGLNYSGVMEGVPEYTEHMEGVHNKERGELVNKAVVNGSENTTEDVDPFWQSHPELLEEAKQMNAPLTAKDFKEQGFVFAEGDDGKKHIWATTPEYKKWQEGGGEGKKPQRYEDLRERWIRKFQSNPLGALEEFANSRQVDFLSQDAVNFVYDAMYPAGIRGALDEVVKGDILKGVRESYPDDEQGLKNTAKMSAREAYSEAFGKDKMATTGDEIVEQASHLVEYWHPNLNSRFVYDASRVGDLIIKAKLRQDIPAVVEEMSPEDVADIKRNAAYDSLERGEFFPKTFEENPADVDAVMSELGLDKGSDKTVLSALSGYGGEDKAPEIDYFDLKNKLAEMINKGKDSGVACSRGVLYVKDSYGSPSISDSVSEKAMEKIRTATANVVEQLRNGGIEEAMELAKKRGEENEKEKLVDMMEERGDTYLAYEIENYADAKTTKTINPNKAMREVVERAISEDALGYFIGENAVYEALGNLHSMEIDIDHRELIRDTLLKRIMTGQRKDRRGEIHYDATGIFDTEGFRDNQDKLGIDFNDPEMFALAFNGFMNTLKSRNGEHSKQADWYYENIFANDPGKFLAMEKAFREESDDVGAKRKITKFFKNNPQAFEDRARALLEERLQKEINNEQHAIKSSVLQDIPKGDFKKMLDKYTAYLLQKGNEHTTEIGSAFTGEHRRTSGKEEETGKVDRREKAFDFALDKVRCFKKYESFIEQNVADGDINRFCTAFVSDMNYDRMYSADNSFMGIEFKYGDKWCAIAESVGADGATYVFRGDNEGEYLDMFDNLRFDARRSDDPRFIAIDHLDSEHFDDSLDLTYKKVFLFLKTGEKALRYYNAFGSNNEKAKREWDKRQKEEFSAWPMGIKAEDEEDDDYKAWHEKQDAIEARLKEALERGGQEELEAERRRIEEEDYDRLMNEVA